MRRIATLRTAGQSERAASAKRQYDARRQREVETRKLYKTAAWARVRAAQLAASPLCIMCEADDVVTVATVCDHIEPHRGDVAKFWTGPFQSLCARCHSSAKQKEEAGARRV